MGSIYCITNLVNDKYYVGQTIRTVNERFNGHGSKPVSSLYLPLKKYGKSSFAVDVLAQSEDRDELDKLEMLWILITGANVRGIGYNKAVGGRTPRHTEETKRRQSAAHLGRNLSESHRKAIGCAHLGRRHSSESIRKMSAIAASKVDDNFRKTMAARAAGR